jgi:peptide/nickel transport system substrate-binding protein
MKIYRISILLIVCGLILYPACNIYAQIKNPDTFIMATYGTLRTLDPAACYDDTGSQRIWNIYETLIFFDGSHTDKFTPVLATRVPTLENGGISSDGRTITFEIRKGVSFQQGGILTPQDVAYSFKRAMIVDPDGGPMWMLLEALTGKRSTRNPDGKIIDGIFNTIDKAVTASADSVTLFLPRPYPPLMSILAYSASSILDRDWAISNGCWDGDIKNAARYNNPAPGHEPLQKIANGTGAYRMKRWEPAKQFIFERFDGYWGPRPALKTAIVKYVKEWSTRKLMLQNGDADRVTVDIPYVPEVKAMPGLKYYKVPQLSVSFALFCQKMDPRGNPNIGSGKLDGNGIPPDFFSDIHVRRAFSHALDRKTYKEDVFNNMVIMPTSPNIEGLPYHEDVAYNTGNAMREAAALMLAENIMSLNPKFHIELRNVEWKDYLVQYRSFRYPIFITGWAADYADPHNFLNTFMHSQGVYGRYMALRNPEIDRLCETGIATVDSNQRAQIYSKLQHLWYEKALGIPLYQQINMRTYRDYVHGYVMLTDAWEDLKRIYKK